MHAGIERPLRDPFCQSQLVLLSQRWIVAVPSSNYTYYMIVTENINAQTCLPLLSIRNGAAKEPRTSKSIVYLSNPGSRSMHQS